MDPKVNPADTAWMLRSTALVLMTTPALGFFQTHTYYSDADPFGSA